MLPGGSSTPGVYAAASVGFLNVMLNCKSHSFDCDGKKLPVVDVNVGNGGV